MLQHLLDATPRGIYWGYLSARARALNLPHQTPETWLKSGAMFQVVAPIVAPAQSGRVKVETHLQNELRFGVHDFHIRSWSFCQQNCFLRLIMIR